MTSMLYYLILSHACLFICQGIDFSSDDDDDKFDHKKLHLVGHLAHNMQNKFEQAPMILTHLSKGDSKTKYHDYKKPSTKKTMQFDGICKMKLIKGGWNYYPFPGSCNQYLHCDKAGNSHVETCAVGTFFSGHHCKRAQEVECLWDPCRKFPDSHLYSDAQTCYGYYKCIKSRSVSGICPSGFAFNAIKQGCLPDPTCKQPTGILDPCFAGTTLAFPGQPHMFYLWDGLESVTSMTCPKGLWYNPHICTCDWVIPGKFNHESCSPMFHFGYNGDFLEEYNKAPQFANTAVSIYQKSALFNKGGRIVIWMMNNMDMDSQWAMCFEFMTQVFQGEVALVSNDWKHNHFTYKITYIPLEGLVKGYFRMKDKSIVELVVMGVKPAVPHFIRVAKHGAMMTMRVDNMPTASVKTHAGVASSNSPMVIGSSHGCVGFMGFFDELKFFRCVPKHFFGDYKAMLKR